MIKDEQFWIDLEKLPYNERLAIIQHLDKLEQDELSDILPE